MLQDIVGDWGSGLGEADHARALAALGVLEATGTHQHRASADPDALAAALATEFSRGERTPMWRGAHNLGPATGMAAWRQTLHGDPTVLAEAWRRYRSAIDEDRQMPRLALASKWRDRTDLFDFDALCAWLRHPDVGLDALVVADPHEGPLNMPWHWPLRVGVPAGALQAGVLGELRRTQGQRWWVAELSSCFAVGSARDACDLLILTGAGATELLAARRTRLRASFVVCIEALPADPGPALARHGALREMLGAAGVAVLGDLDPGTGLGDWYTELLREVSHDLPIHAAVTVAARRALQREVLVSGQPQALDRCRILAIAERQDLVLEGLRRSHALDQPAADPLDFGEPTFGGGGTTRGGGPPPPVGGAGQGLAHALRSRAFTAESVDGVDAARDLQGQGDAIEQARVQRWIQARAWRGDAPEPSARTLAPAAWNLMAVHVGPIDLPRSDSVFPEALLDFSRGAVNVSVQLELAGASVAALDAAELLMRLGRERSLRAGWLLPGDMDGTEDPLAGPLARLVAQRQVDAPAQGDDKPVGLASATISLPAFGASSMALFAVCPQARTRQVEGRVVMIHGNRVLQTARLSVATGAAADPGEGVHMATDPPIHPRDDDLQDRRAYDVTILVSDVGDKLHLAIQQDGEPKTVQLDDLKAPIDAIRAALKKAANEWDFSKPLGEQPVFPDTLYALAANGSALQQHLRKHYGDRIDGWERIHLVPATNAYLPLEYLYDGPPPGVDAQPCRNMPGALGNAAGCGHALQTASGAVACPHEHDPDALCAMHFWGFRRLIERNGRLHAMGEPAAGGAVPAAPAALSVPTKRSYGKVRSLLFAATDRAFLYANGEPAQQAERAALVESMHVLAPQVLAVDDWTQWRERALDRPDLLMLLVHTDVYRGARAIEIGHRKYLGYQQILQDLSGAGGKPQLLILLGCSAADVNENFQPYPESFREAGVNIVLAPLAPIRGADAVPIARRLAERLAERLAASEPTTFGEMLPLLRRELLREGHPGVLGLLGFGDGDWLLEGQAC